jgi:hypothetical protein
MMARIDDVGYIVPVMSGWDTDPRELWEIPEAAAYIRCWVEIARITMPLIIDLIVREKIPEFMLGPLVGCGAFGEEIRRRVRIVPRGTPITRPRT